MRSSNSPNIAGGVEGVVFFMKTTLESFGFDAPQLDDRISHQLPL